MAALRPMRDWLSTAAPWGPKVSNNFDSVPALPNPVRGAKLDGLVAELEAAGGSPRKKPPDHSPQKKPRGEEILLLCLNRAKVIARQGQEEAVVIKQEIDGVGNLGEDEEELDDEDIKDADGLKDGIAARDEAGFESIPVIGLTAVFGSTTGGKKSGENRTGHKRCRFFSGGNRGRKFQGTT